MTQPLNKPKTEPGWETANAPELWTWDKPGSLLSGILLGISKVEISGKAVRQMLFQVSKDRQVKCLQTYDLLQKVTDAHRGCYMRITYLGEDETIKRGDNAMKVFDVQYKRPEGTAPARDTGPITDEPPARDTGPITDEDIPF